MGIWACGVFDNDDASDFLGDVVRGLSDTIRADLATLDKPRDLELIRPTVAAIACLRAIVTMIDKAKFNMQKSEVELWREKYLKWFDRIVLPVWGNDQGTKEYRRNVKREFRLLINRLKNWDDWKP